jgi:ferrochelatase
VPDVRRYLREFLMDGRVLDAAWPIRFCIVHLAILPSRPKESAHAYSGIWTPEGSPLVVTSRNVQKKLRGMVSIPVELAMRYQNPSIPEAVGKLAAQGATEVLLIPLFPHYAMSSFETAVVRVREVAASMAPRLRFVVQPPCYQDADYIEALAASAEPFLRKPYDHVLFSYHGLPERHLRKSDPTGCHCLRSPNCCETPSPAHEFCYRAQCFKTTQLFVQKVGVPTGRYSVSFQSRLGRDPWLAPATDTELVRLAKEGKKRLVVLCPAFVSDCLETIEEIGMRGRGASLESGGAEFRLVPCLNEHPLWLKALRNMVQRFLGETVKTGSNHEQPARPSLEGAARLE